MCLVCTLQCPACAQRLEGATVLYQCLPIMRGTACHQTYNATRSFTPTEAVLIKRSCDNPFCTMNVTQQLMTQIRLLHLVKFMDLGETTMRQSEDATDDEWSAGADLRYTHGSKTFTIKLPTAADCTSAQDGHGPTAPEANTNANIFLHHAMKCCQKFSDNLQHLKKFEKTSAAHEINKALRAVLVNTAKRIIPVPGPGDVAFRSFDNTKRAVLTANMWKFICARDSFSSLPVSVGTGQASQNCTPYSTSLHHTAPSNSSGQAPGPRLAAHSTTAHPSASTASTVPNQGSFDHILPRTDPQMTTNDPASDDPDDRIDPGAYGRSDNQSGTPAQPATEVGGTPAFAPPAQPQYGYPNPQPVALAVPAQSDFGYVDPAAITQLGSPAFPTQGPEGSGAPSSRKSGSSTNDDSGPLLGDPSWSADPST